MTLLTKDVPKHSRKLIGLESKPHIVGPFEDEILSLASFGDTGEVSLDVGGKYRNARTRKSLSHHLQRDGFAGAGRTRDEAVAIGERERQPGRLFALSDKDHLAGVGELVIRSHHCLGLLR